METLWNEARIEQLTALYEEGLSYSRIAGEIGLSKNAVIGKARRMQLPARIQLMACDRNSADKAGTKAGHDLSALPALPAVQNVDSGDSGCSILELTDWTCRYPLWSTEGPAGARFYCGHPTASLSEGRPYCPVHALKCHTIR